MRTLSLGLQELHAPWDKSGPIETLLDVFQHCAWAPFQQMGIDDTMQAVPFDAETVVKGFSRGRNRTVYLAHLENGVETVRGAISKSPTRNIVTLQVRQDQWPGIQPALEFMQRVAYAFSNFQRGDGSADRGISDYYVDNRLHVLPDCLGEWVAWAHLVSPAGYEPYYDRDVLLKTPAWRVEELDRGLIQIVSYEDPYAYDTPDNRAKLHEINDYLVKHAKKVP